MFATSFRRAWGWIVAAAFAWSCQSAMAGTFNDTFNSFDPYGYDKFHQDLGNKKKYDAVGKIISRTGGGGAVGSGTLIGKRWVLTAAHCVAGADRVKFRIDGKVYEGKTWYVPKDYSYDVLGNGADIALVFLDEPVKSVKPAKIANRSNNPVGDIVTTVGYGTSGTGLTGSILPYGTKRAGRNTIDSTLFGNRILMSDFDPPDNLTFPTSIEDFPVVLEYSAAGGDSGGGIFDDSNQVVGVVSFGTIGSPYFGISGDTNVAAHYNWIRKVLRLHTTDRKRLRQLVADKGNSVNPLPDLLSLSLYDEEFGQLLAPRAYMNHPDVLAAYAALIPEPASAVLLAAGSLALLRRRRGA